MTLYHKWDVKNGFAYVLKVFSLISDGLGGVPHITTCTPGFSDLPTALTYIHDDSSPDIQRALMTFIICSSGRWSKNLGGQEIL